MKALPKEGDWVTCVSRYYEWVRRANVELGGSYKIIEIDECGAARHGSSCPAIIVEGVKHPSYGRDIVWLELPDFFWETEFEKMVREASES